MTGTVSGTATVLFTDLVGSTELMVRLGDTAFDALRDEHFRRLERAVASCRGVQVKNTGDGILATFSSAVDALAAGVAVQQATERHARAAEVPCSVRLPGADLDPDGRLAGHHRRRHPQLDGAPDRQATP